MAGSAGVKRKSGTDKEKQSKKRKIAVVVHQDDNRHDEESLLDSSKKKWSAGRSDMRASMEEDVKELETSKPSALFRPVHGRNWTLSIAVPGSIISNVSKPDHKTMLAGRIARAAAVFCVDEIVVFDDDPSNVPDYIDRRYKTKHKTKTEILDSIDENDQPWQNPDQFLYHVLSYAECPPYLRMDSENPSASLFGQHQNLRWAGLLPSLDMPHHLKSHEWCRYREGVTLGPARTKLPKSKDKKHDSSHQDWTYVKCGLPHPVKIPVQIPPSTRVTLRFANADQPPSWPHLSQEQCEQLDVQAVDPTTPREEGGYYWGYSVRRATSLSDVLVSCDFADGYDVSVGTSERGAPLTAVLPKNVSPRSRRTQGDEGVERLPDAFQHLLLVFGGVAGLEPAVASDPELRSKGLTKETAHQAFDAWVNLVQGQGSRTIRTEEAVEFGLFGLKPYVDSMYDEAAVS